MENSNINELIYKGATSFIKEDYLQSIEIFSNAIKIDSQNFEARLYRASSYIQNKDYNEALNDLEIAEKINPKSFEVYYKKGITLFKLGRFLDSNDTFKKALTLITISEQKDKLALWSNKLDIELEERNLLNPLPKEDPINIKIIHSWYQNPTHVVVSLDSTVNFNKENFDFVIEKKNIKIISKISNKTIWEMNLSNGIIPEQSTSSFTNKKAEFKLKKEIDHFNWVNVEKSKVQEVTNNNQPAYPTSAKVKKDWNNLEMEINKEIKEDEKNDPNTAMMRLFQEIYKNASEDTRRAMMKSYQTSGGTVLSTNWDEVKEKDYEGKDKPDAPKGQEWRKNDY